VGSSRLFVIALTLRPGNAVDAAHRAHIDRPLAVWD
jgi:hypothetical protein